VTAQGLIVIDSAEGLTFEALQQVTPVPLLRTRG